MSTEKNRKDKTKWKKYGIYTYSQPYAKALAIGVGIYSKPEVHQSGYYGHYNDDEHNYHIWFGGKKFY